jgi:enoyl-CoA hydratase
MGAQILTAAQAAELGLVHQVVPAGQALNRALELARQWAELPAFAVQSTKRALNVHLKAAVAAVMPLALALEELSMASEEFRATLARTRGEAGPAS